MSQNRKVAWIILVLQVVFYTTLITGCGSTREANISRTVQSTVLLDRGSGVAIAPNVILTARHVVEGMSVCTIVDNDGNEFESVQIILSDTEDAALVIIAESVFTPVKLGTRAKCYVGQPVYVVGTPFNDRFANSVAVGVISSLNRDYGDNDPGGGNTWDDVIQIDCRVNPGNSGGPVSTMNGVMIGIVSGVYDTNITLVIPVDEFLDEFMPYLRE